MRVERIDLIAYGHYRDASLDLSTPRNGLTLVYGPNEAGKSTARRAFLAALFGITARSQDAFFYRPGSLKVGASLSSARRGSLDFVRQGAGVVATGDGQGGPVPPEVLEGFLGGVSRDLYLRLFSVGHDDLRSGSEALLDAEGEIGRLVFGASLGAGSLTGVLRRLDERADRLYKDRGHIQRVPVELKDQRDKMDRAKKLRVRARDWEAKRNAVLEAEQRVKELEGLLLEARVSHTRMRRMREAMPLAAQRTERLTRLADIGSKGPVASREWAGRARDAQERYERAARERSSVAGRKLGLDEQLAAVAVADDVIARAALIDGLLRGVDRYDKDRSDLGERRVQLDRAASQLSQLLEQLGLRSDDGRVVDEVALTNVEELAQRHAALQAGMDAASDELAKLQGQIETLERRLADAGAAPDVTALSRAASLAAPELGREDSLVVSREAVRNLESEVQTRSGRLGLAGRSLAEIEAMAIPTAKQLSDEQGRRQEIAARRAQLDREQERLETDIARVDDLVAEILAKPGIPDEDLLRVARSHRDSGWRIARQAIETGRLDADSASAWAKGEAFLAAYEDAVAKADAAADERFVHAADITSLEGHRTRLGELTEALSGLAGRRDTLEADAAAGDERWRDLWEKVGVQAQEPELMVAWREDQQELLGLIGELAAKAAAYRSDSELVANHVSALSSAIARTGNTPDPGGLRHLAAQASDITADAQAKTQIRRDIETELGKARLSLPERRNAVESQREALGSWQGLWAEALGALRLPASTQPAGALAAVRAYRALPGARREVKGFELRIAGIERDVANFAQRVADAAAGIVDRPGAEPLEVVEELGTRLGAAREATTRRETLQVALSEVEDQLRQSDEDLAQASRDLAALRNEAGLGGDVELGEVISRSVEAADARDRLAELESDLVAVGSGLTLREVLAEVDSLDMSGDELAAATDALADAVARLEGDLAQANVTLGQRKGELEAVTDERSAADLEQEAQEHLASAVTHASEYVRTAVAARMLRKVMADYGESHRGPMLARAGDIFSALTKGAFAELVPDVFGENQKLYAKRRNGELLSTGALSDGARDQLYLALRLAGIEYQLEHLEEPVPVVFDDVLVNFDDDRSGAALGVLAGLGHRTQVVLFSHHESLVDAARAALPAGELGVVRLSPRDHDAAAPAASVGYPAGADGETEPASQAVLRALSDASRPLSKAELLASGAIDESSWSRAIRSLVDSGAVRQDGQKRGARYRLET